MTTDSEPHSSAQLAILMNLVELARRCGLRPSDAPAWVYYVGDVPADEAHHALEIVGGEFIDPDIDEKYSKFKELLGMTNTRKLKVQQLYELEDIVDRALDLAPRARHRS